MLKKIIFALVLSLSSRAFCTDFVICMGSFRNYDYAKERLHLLSLSDIPVFIAEVKKGDDVLFYRVLYSDYFDSAKEAKTMLFDLEKRAIVKKLGIKDLWICKKSDHVQTISDL